MIKYYIFFLLAGITLGSLLFIIGLAPLIKNALLSFSGINTTGKVIGIKKDVPCGFFEKGKCPVYSVRFYTKNSEELEFASDAPNRVTYQLNEEIPVVYTAWLKKNNAIIKEDTSGIKTGLILFIPGLLILAALVFGWKNLTGITSANRKGKFSIQEFSKELSSVANAHYGIQPIHKDNNKIKGILYAIVSLFIAIFFLGGQFIVGYNGGAILFGFLALCGVVYNLDFNNKLRINPDLVGLLGGILFTIMFLGTFFYVFIVDPFIK